MLVPGRRTVVSQLTINANTQTSHRETYTLGAFIFMARCLKMQELGTYRLFASLPPRSNEWIMVL